MGVSLGREYVLTLSCPDKPGIVYVVSSFLVQHSANILASQQYGESPGRSVLHAGAHLRAAARPRARLLLGGRGVSHGLAAAPERLAEVGRDVEAQVLARAVTWHAEHRVLLNGDRTVVFH
jgi:formyltetrahydrofolate hydrolase